MQRSRQISRLKFWQDEEGNYKLPLQEAAAVKQELIGLMVSVPPGIQSQLGEAASLIAESDFWEQWDTLVDVRLHHHLCQSHVQH